MDESYIHLLCAPSSSDDGEEAVEPHGVYDPLQERKLLRNDVGMLSASDVDSDDEAEDILEEDPTDEITQNLFDFGVDLEDIFHDAEDEIYVQQLLGECMMEDGPEADDKVDQEDDEDSDTSQVDDLDLFADYVSEAAEKEEWPEVKYRLVRKTSIAQYTALAVRLGARVGTASAHMRRRVLKPSKHCPGVDGTACIFSTTNLRSLQEITPRRGQTHCMFCSNAHLDKLLDQNGGFQITKTLKAMKQLNEEMFQECIENL
eukprot:6027285-Amphidinium_carterae.7